MSDNPTQTQNQKFLVTGITGGIGKSTVLHLLNKGVPASQIIGLARKKDGTEDLASKGIEIRLGDYLDYDSLVHAFQGVDKLMLTSAVAFTDRSKQHYNAITAASQAGVKHLVYMAIMRKEGSSHIIPEVTESDLYTEQILKTSGLEYTIVYHPPFVDFLSLYYDPNPYENGIRIPAHHGKMAPVTRDELAEAHAEILSTTGHENKTYSLGGSNAISFAEIANTLAEIKGEPVTYTSITADEYSHSMLAKGLPLHVAEFILGWVLAIEKGEFEYQSGDIEGLIGRKTKTFREFIESSMHIPA